MKEFNLKLSNRELVFLALIMKSCHAREETTKDLRDDIIVKINEAAGNDAIGFIGEEYENKPYSETLSEFMAKTTMELPLAWELDKYGVYDNEAGVVPKGFFKKD